ncbi:MAG: hypothetical protein QM831_08890 [Kofleriaceae bacterium]
MTKAITLAFMLVSGLALADHGHYHPKDSAGVWTGTAIGTFNGTPYYSTSTITISRDGQTASTVEDSTLGPATTSCTLTSWNEWSVSVAHCTFTSGAATGVEVDVHFTLTGGEHLKLWASTPALSLSEDATHPDA